MNFQLLDSEKFLMPTTVSKLPRVLKLYIWILLSDIKSYKEQTQLTKITYEVSIF